jgi:hypothetical protein
MLTNSFPCSPWQCRSPSGAQAGRGASGVQGAAPDGGASERGQPWRPLRAERKRLYRPWRPPHCAIRIGRLGPGEGAARSRAGRIRRQDGSARSQGRGHRQQARWQAARATYGRSRPAGQVNLTDEESRIMPVPGSGFEQCYNAQAAAAGSRHRCGAGKQRQAAGRADAGEARRAAGRVGRD